MDLEFAIFRISKIPHRLKCRHQLFHGRYIRQRIASAEEPKLMSL